ncbi:preprotein translocase subunit SecG [Brackiella oedipodis]|uniref:preprotein translocase subunit SecG n=1 Tax=Brackiella oedipodis TaxID=124225 RepID=UPI00048E2B04|nr:preprotein translocase subunit SecG [Brackiella oedipodis]
MPPFVFSILIIVQVVTSLALIVLILLQQGKGADMGSSFGSGSAGSLFGSAGSANFFSRLTKWLAIVFFAATLGLAYLGSQHLYGHSTKSSSNDAGLMSDYQDPGIPEPSASETAPSTEAPVDDSIPSAPDSKSDAAAPAIPDDNAAQSDKSTQ